MKGRGNLSSVAIRVFLKLLNCIELLMEKLVWFPWFGVLGIPRGGDLPWRDARRVVTGLFGLNIEGEICKSSKDQN